MRGSAVPILPRPGENRKPTPRPAPRVQTDAHPTDEPARSRRRRSRAGDEPFIARVVNDWWTRLLEAVIEGSLSEQEERYASHLGRRDYVWNTLGTSSWGLTFPALTVVATQLAGVEEAGMFSMAFIVGTLLMIAVYYGVRTFQVSDLDEACSFASYQAHRAAIALIAAVAGVLYVAVRGYDAQMAIICAGVFIYKIVDGIADVYEGRLQQADKLYLAGISQTVRSVGAVAAFALALLVTRSLAVASVVMAVAAVASLGLLTAPLALLETDKSRPVAASEVGLIFRQCFPLFCALFLFNLIESVPKFVMEGALAYENQLYFNALYFPAQGILLTVGALYKPQLLRLASIWANPRKRRRFNLIIVAVMAVIAAITAVMALVMHAVGLPLMSILYGVDFGRFALLSFLMIVAGGITAGIDFLYAVIAILRRQDGVIRLYLIATAAALVLSLVLVNLLGLAGAVWSYLATMVVLFVLIALEYGRIQRAIARERSPFRDR